MFQYFAISDMSYMYNYLLHGPYYTQGATGDGALDLQVNLIITLSFGSMKTDRVISEPCYNEVIYNRHIAK